MSSGFGASAVPQADPLRASPATTKATEQRVAGTQPSAAREWNEARKAYGNDQQFFQELKEGQQNMGTWEFVKTDSDVQIVSYDNGDCVMASSRYIFSRYPDLHAALVVGRTHSSFE